MIDRMRKDGSETNGPFFFDKKKVEQRLARHRHRAKKYGCTSEKITADDILAIIERQKYRCAYSHDPLDGKWEIEHLKALNEGGTNTLDNLIVVSRLYNRSKKDRGLDYLVEDGRADAARLANHEDDWEAEADHDYMVYIWNKDFREDDEPERDYDWSGFSSPLDEFDKDDKTRLDTNDILDVFLGLSSSTTEDWNEDSGVNYSETDSSDDDYIPIDD